MPPGRDSRAPLSATTHPVASTGHVRRDARRLAIRWQHPTSAVTPLDGPSVIGRDPSCATILASVEVSRRHAEIAVAGPLAIVRDLDSRNGVVVDGRRVREAPLELGTVVRLGDWLGLVTSIEGGGFGPIADNWLGGRTLRDAIEPARRVAPTDLPVIAEGETGSGKEGLSRAIHAWSGRTGAFVAVNCAALPTNLVEAELFGYRRGAFTGAERANPGVFRTAHHGTLLLDEILDLPPDVQAKLLRVLEQREVHPLGESRPVPVDVRVVAATQESLADAVAKKRFRADLLARLDGVTVKLPPLRQRREDVVPLFLHVLADLSGNRPPQVDAKLLESLCLYDWPLNVRELVLLARRLLALHAGETVLRRAMLPDRMQTCSNTDSAAFAQSSGRAKRTPTDDDAEFERLVESLRAHGGSVARAAEAMGISRHRAYRLLSARPGFDLESIRVG